MSFYIKPNRTNGSKKVLPIKNSKKFIWLLADALFVCLGLFLSVAFYEISIPAERVVFMLRTAPLIITFTLTALWLAGVYKMLLSYASTDTFLRCAVTTLLGTGITYLISLVIYLLRGSPLFLIRRPIYLMQWVFTLILIAGSRFAVKYRKIGFRSTEKGKRILIIGAGYEGATVIRDIQNGRYGDSRAVALIDEDQIKWNSNINRVPVIGGQDQIESAIEKHNIDEIIITVSSPERQLIDRCFNTGCKVRVFSRAQGVARELNIGDLLGRPETHLDMVDVRTYFSGKKVMVTGGGGSIGSELCRQLLAFTPKQLIIYDISENYMFDLLFELKEKYGELVANTVTLEVGSVRDEESLWRVMGKYKPDIVIHAAAHKHVPLMEESPEQAVLNNVFGTEKTARIAKECGVERFVLISTDKAVNPTNVMGATKRLAEMIIRSMDGKTQFMAVRFGNVLGSHGSVVPIFERQIKAGGPVTITHPDIIRYFMTITEAASLVLQAAAMAAGGELFILDMGKPVKIKDLAEKMIQLYGTGEEQIVYTGLRPGEKLYEELLWDEEHDMATEKDRIFIAKQDPVDQETIQNALTRLENCLDSHGDVKIVLAEIVPTYKATKNTMSHINRSGEVFSK